jgi:hypothetical protein
MRPTAKAMEEIFLIIDSERWRFFIMEGTKTLKLPTMFFDGNTSADHLGHQKMRTYTL